MGKILTRITVTNHVDQILAERGIIPASGIRSVTLDDVLVDTGATLLWLPRETVVALGAEPLREVNVNTATGLERTRIFRDIELSVLGRPATVECLELPGSQQPLLGVQTLEALGIEIDLQKQQLRLLPYTSQDTFYTA